MIHDHVDDRHNHHGHGDHGTGSGGLRLGLKTM